MYLNNASLVSFGYLLIFMGSFALICLSRFFLLLFNTLLTKNNRFNYFYQTNLYEQCKRYHILFFFIANMLHRKYCAELKKFFELKILTY